MKVDIENLVSLCKKGDQEAFAQLYDCFVDKIYRYIAFRVPQDEAEDIAGEVFLKVWEKIDSYKPQEGAQFSSWIFRIAHNLIVDFYRKNKMEMVNEMDIQLVDKDKLKDPKFNAENTLSYEALKAAMVGLKDDQRDVITHRFVNGLDNAEIAVLMNTSEGNVRILQFRALKVLRNNLEMLGFDYSL